MTPIIRVEDLHYAYAPDHSPTGMALNGVDLAIYAGEYVAILGHNGSGKSTLARHFNGLLLPTRGDVWVRDWNTRMRRHLRAIRAAVGMVFQTPDNQIVATIVEEDVAFGPENLGLPHAQLVERVDWALDQVEMTPFRRRAPHLLSGGQKQRICIAGVLAMRPDVLVLDEATAMLDPAGRQEVLSIARRLNREEGTTIVAITHFMEEAAEADRVIVMDRGRIAMQGAPRQIFQRADELRALQMEPPQITQLAQALHRVHPAIRPDILGIDELARAIAAAGLRIERPYTDALARNVAELPADPVIELDAVAHRYMRDTPLEVLAIADVNLTVRRGETLGLIGHTGSGKSTVVQHFNALLRPSSGTVRVSGQAIDDAVDLKQVRRTVGLVFQQPETQLFERYVGDDVAYGPRNLGLGRDEVRARVRRAMESVGLGFEAFKDRLTFGLSGGQMRRVALAGVLALEPAILVLDEPTSGLDPAGRRQLLDLLVGLNDQGITVVVISHNMEELGEICDRFYVIANGTTVAEGTPAAIFRQPALLTSLGLALPPVATLFERLAEAHVLSSAHLPVYTMDHALGLLKEARRGEL